MDSGVSNLPFRDLEIFKEQTARNLVSLSPEDKVSELTQADKDAETVLLGTLRSHLNELHEALSWQYATMQDVENQRRRLLTACEEQLELLKREYLPRLAREHGITEEFCSAVKKSSTVDDFERLADLDFGLMVWRQNLKRSMSLAASWQDKEEQARSAYIEAEALVKRCLNNSHQLWNRIMLWTEASAPRQSAYSLARSPSRARSKSLSDAPLGGDSIITIYERAMAQVWLRLEAVAQQHGVADALQALVRIDRASEHPLSFGQVAVALDQVTRALGAGQPPDKAQDIAIKAASDAPITPPVLSGAPSGRLSKPAAGEKPSTAANEE